MKKCEFNLMMTNKRGNILIQIEKKTRRDLCYRFVDAIIDDNLIQAQEPLMELLKHLEKRRDYGVSVLRAAVRRDEVEKE